MKAFTVLLFFLLAGYWAKSQDLLVKTDSTKIKCAIKELSEEKVVINLKNNAPDSIQSFGAYEIAYIVLRNGYTKRYWHEPIINANAQNYYAERNKRDSLNYYRYRQSLSINYLSFFNRELNIIYGRDYRRKHLYLQIPVSIGFNYPKVTGKYYFKNMFTYNLHQKIIDVAAGAYYVPSYIGKVNFFIGPLYKLQFYSGQQVLLPETNQPLVVKNTTIMRNSVSITTGVMIRTKSRISTSALISLGALHDMAINKIRRTSNNQRVDPIVKPSDFYFWAGFMVGFSF